jgi:hypothetical protein
MSRMRFPLLTTAMVLLVTPAVLSQPDRSADFEALRVSFITRKLKLTPEEAQVFWPVFNEFEAELGKVRDERKRFGEAVTDWSALSDEQVKDHLTNLLALDQKELDLKKTYTQRLFQVIPPYKVALLYKAIEDFKRWLIDRARQQRPGPRQGGN